MDPHAYEQFRALEQTHWWFRGRRKVYLGLLRHHLNGARPSRVLDLGTGAGGFLEGLREIGAVVHPTDTDFDSLRRCAQRGFERGVLGSGYNLPYANSSFDLVCLFDVLEHLDDDACAMREVARVLKPGGLVFLTVPAYPWMYANNDRVAHHRRRYTRATLRMLFDRAKLLEERNTHTNVALFPAIALAVLSIKTAEAVVLRERKSTHTNLSWPMPQAVHDVFYAAFAAELPLSRRFDLPFGHSIAAIARRK